MNRRWLGMGILLLLVLLCGFVACSGNGAGDDVTTDASVDMVDLILPEADNYIVIREDFCSVEVKNAAMYLRKRINEEVGAKIKIGSDLDYDPGTEGYEILIGETNRPESAQAKEMVGEGEYIIRLLENKTVVIVGYDDVATVAGVNAFLTAYLGEGAVSVPSGLKQVGTTYAPPLKNEDGTITFVSWAPSMVRVVYASSDIVTVQREATALCAAINSATGATALTGISVVSDADVAAQDGAYEILVGNTNRAASVDAKKGLGDNQYIIKFLDERTVVLLGSSPKGTVKAVEAFINTYLPYDTEEEEYKVDVLKLPSDLSMGDHIVNPSATHNLGLQVREDGTITLGGKEFQAIGVNWHGAFDRIYYHRDQTDMDVFFKTLKDNNIPYFRLMMGVFYEYDYKDYVNNTEAYFKAMDELVELAEKYEIGMICSLMWQHGAIWTYNGEAVTALADPNSKSIRFARGYVTDVVSRYVDSPAIWGWEIGNEGNLDADILPGMTTEVLSTYYKLIGQTIADIDASRLLTGGDAYPRAPSKALRETGYWSPNDSREDVIETFGYYTPDPLNTISVHIYGEKDNDDYVAASIADLRAKATELGIGAFVGEFGPGSHRFENLEDKIGPEDPNEAAERAYFKTIVDLFIENDVQVLCAWSYGRMIQGHRDDTSIEYGMYNGIYQNAYQIDYMREVNNRLEEEGLNCAADYWAQFD